MQCSVSVPEGLTSYLMRNVELRSVGDSGRRVSLTIVPEIQSAAASVKWHSAFLAPFPTFSAIYWLFCNFCSTGKAMYQFKKVDRYFRWGIRSFLAGGKKKLEKSSAVLLMCKVAGFCRYTLFSRVAGAEVLSGITTTRSLRYWKTGIELSSNCCPNRSRVQVITRRVPCWQPLATHRGDRFNGVAFTTEAITHPQLHMSKL
jgi:hypothetical protein